MMQATALPARGTSPSGATRSRRERILRAAERMNRLIHDLLDVTLIEAGQLGIERARVSARQLLADAVDAQRPLAASASLELRLELERRAARRSGAIAPAAARCSRT